MSILSDLRLKRRGQLDQLRTQRKAFESDAIDALTIILMKADSLAEISTLDTDAIRRAAEKLNDNAVAIRSIDRQITAINEELNG
jgi:hypothetical protein